MLQEQIMAYIREKTGTTALIAVGMVLILLLLVLIQVTRTRREVHKICKKIRRYFDVVFTEEGEEAKQPAEVKAEEVPVYRTADELERQREEEQAMEDAKLLMDIISDVF